MSKEASGKTTTASYPLKWFDRLTMRADSNAVNYGAKACREYPD